MGSQQSLMPPKKKDDKKSGGKSDSKKNLKDFLAKSGKSGASAKKKKWSKGKVREKLNNMVCFDQNTFDRMKEGATMKLVTPSTLSERLKVSGSLARRSIQELLKAGSIKLVDKHSNQYIYTRNTSDDA